jgi:hypothetical protein
MSTSGLNDARHTLATAHAALARSKTAGRGQVALAERARAVARMTSRRRHSTMAEAAMLVASHSRVEAAS